ncbi:YopX family protein [Pediococcus pentosaceus]|uniref:YopX family protein n=1 Tax=Pediococcus pentosaceus TaxID=1255 RepID=UPI0018FEA32E|nr:YopX family protein [Pediococcus pentosaceus]MBF7122776.1 hypothetical protein [Pediococcus pentosaceus]
MIKFRAWDNECKVMREYDELKGLTLDALDASGFEFEQFTGLKDTYGKEIYEGDILATSSMVEGGEVTDYLKVEWREEYAGFYCGEKPLYACLSEWDNDTKLAQTYPEIVGNVHENPKLLEEDK